MDRQERLNDLLGRLQRAGEAGIEVRLAAEAYGISRQQLYVDMHELQRRGVPVEPAGYGRWRVRGKVTQPQDEVEGGWNR